MARSITLETDFQSTAQYIQFDGGKTITLSDASAVFEGQYTREGRDLKIEAPDGATYKVVDYFAHSESPAIITTSGAMLSGATVDALAGPAHAGQVAQAGKSVVAAGKLVNIGKVQTLDGQATIKRADGTTVKLKVGEQVFQGDVVETAKGSKVSITFTDGSIFAVSENARMVLDKMVYDPGGSSNSMLFNLIQGTFSFIAGKIASTGKMEVETPVATMGIRGTTVVASVEANTGATKFSLVNDPDGTTGRFSIFNKQTGTLIGTLTATDKSLFVSSINAAPIEIPRDTAAEQSAVDYIYRAYQDFQRRGDVEPDTNNQNPLVQKASFQSSGISDQPDPSDPLQSFQGSTVNNIAPLGETPTVGTLPGGTTETTATTTEEPAEAPLPPATAGDTEPAVPQPPVFNVPGLTLNVTEDGSVTVTGFSLSAGSTAPITVTITAQSTVTLASTVGLTFITGDGLADETMQFTGAPTDIENALNGLDYFPTPDNDVSGGLTIDLDDGSFVVSATLNVNITPVPEDPRANNDSFTAVEDSVLNGDVTADNGGGVDIEPDTGDSFSITQLNGAAASFGSATTLASGAQLTLQSNGTFSYTPSDSLTEGQIFNDSFTYTIQDTSGGTDTATVNIQVTGVNDAPAIETIEFFAENFSSFPNNVLMPASFLGFDWPNSNGWIGFAGRFESLSLQSQQPNLTIDRNGEGFIFQGINIRGEVGPNTYTAELRGFRDGQLVAQETINITVGGTVAAFSSEILVDQVVISEYRNGAIFGSNAGLLKSDFVRVFIDDFSYGIIGQSGQIAGSNTGSVTEITDGATGENTANQTATGSFIFSDVDIGDTHTVTTTDLGSGYLGAFAAVVGNTATADGTGRIDWTFTVNDAALDSLASGDVVTQSYSVTVRDGQNVPATETVTITINGTNDAPVVSAVTNPAAVPEGDTGVLSNVVFDLRNYFTASDVDNGETPAIDIGSIMVSDANSNGFSTNVFAVSPTEPTLTVDTANFDSLAAGQQAIFDVSFNIVSGSDTVGRTAQITLTGANDAPVVSAISNPTPVPEGDVGVLTNVFFDLNNYFTATDIDQGETPAIDTSSIVISANPTSNTTIISPFVIFPTAPTVVVVDTANYDFLNSGQQAVVDVTFDVVSGSDRIARTATFTIIGQTDSTIFEDFEGGATGWVELAPDRTHYADNKTDATEAATFTEFLGRFSGTGAGGPEGIRKTFALSGTQDSITVSFDFYEINSWDGAFGEAFRVFSNGTAILNDQHQMNGGPASFDHTISASSVADRGFPNQLGQPNFDQIWRYEYTIETSSTSYDLGFGAILDPNVLDDESFGIDNLSIIENSDTLLGTTGADVLRDGDGAFDIIQADAGNDIVILEATADISNTFNPNFTNIDGGTGQDILQLDDAGTLNLTTISASALTSFEAIDLNTTTANVLTLNLEDVQGISETTNSSLDAALSGLSGVTFSATDNLLVLGNGSDTLNLESTAGGGWTDTGQDVTISGQTYDVINYTLTNSNVEATIAVDTDINKTGLNTAPSLAALEAAAGTGGTLGNSTLPDYAQISPANFTINLGLTVTFWVRETFRDGTETYLSYDAPGAGDFEIFGTTNGQINVTAQAGATVASVNAPTLTDGDWHHVAIVYAGLTGTTSFYIDGAFAGQGATDSGTFDSGGTIFVGDSGASRYIGSIADIGIWNGQLTAAKISTIANGTVNPADGQLEIFLQFNSTTGQFEDQAGSNNATTVGSIAPAAGPDLTTNTFYENTVNASEQPLIANATVSDAEGNFDGGTLVVSNLTADDHVAVANQGQIGIASGAITFSGTQIGVVGVGSNQTGSGEDLLVTFNSSATATSIEALIEALVYGTGNTPDNPNATSSLTLTLTDAAGASVSQSIGVNVIAEAEDLLTQPSGSATAGADIINGTAGADVLHGLAGNDIIVGNGGADELRGGEGNDILAVSDANFELVQGFNGVDTLRLDGGLDLDLTGLSNLRIQNIEAIDLQSASGASTLTLDIFDVFDLSETAHTDLVSALSAQQPSLNISTVNNLIISGGSGDQVNLDAAAADGSWQDTGSDVTVGGEQHNVFNYTSTAGDVLATVAIETDVSTTT